MHWTRAQHKSQTTTGNCNGTVAAVQLQRVLEWCGQDAMFSQCSDLHSTRQMVVGNQNGRSTAVVVFTPQICLSIVASLLVGYEHIDI